MTERRLRKGDAVEFDFSVYHVIGVIKEDRGPIGMGGRRLYLVEFPFGESTSQIELPASDLKPVRDAALSDRVH